MKALVVSFNHYVGKSAISIELANHFDTECISNTVHSYSSEKPLTLNQSDQNIPRKYLRRKKIIFDFQLSHQSIDNKVLQAAKGCEVIVIPTLTDLTSLEGTIETYKLLNTCNTPIVIIINNFLSWVKFENACQYLRKTLNVPNVAFIKRSILFERILGNGSRWIEKVENEQDRKVLEAASAYNELLFNTLQDLKDIHAKFQHQSAS